MAIIRTGRYTFPAGYAKYLVPTYKPPTFVNPNVGPPFLPSALTINSGINGASQFLTIGVPANLSVITVSILNGGTFSFQFLYPAAVLAAGNIGVSLPLGAGSTAAQVTTALQAVLSLSGATPQGGVFTGFPWQAIQADATHIRINWNTIGGGNTFVSTGVTNITSVFTGAFTQVTPLIPVTLGRQFGFMSAS